MIDMDLRQYRFFEHSQYNCHVYDAVTGRNPAAAKLFKKSEQNIDTTMFCHEAAHSMEFIRNNNTHRLFLNDFGWPPISRISKWTERMAENETRVFAQQELLLDHFKFIRDHILAPDNAGVFLSVMSGQNHNGKYYTDLILKYKEDMRCDFLNIFDEFIQYLIKNTNETRK